jgi:hypothetical protein
MIALDRGFSNADIVTIFISMVALILAVIALVMAILQWDLAKQQTDLSKKQADIAETQHQIMLKQLAKRPDLQLILRGAQAFKTDIGGQPIGITHNYLLGIKNNGDKVANNVSWRVFITADQRLTFSNLPDEIDGDARWIDPKDSEKQEVIKGNGVLSQSVVPGGIADLFSFTVYGPAGPTVIRPTIKWVLRDDEYRHPAEGDGILTLEKVGFSPAQS